MSTGHDDCVVTNLYLKALLTVHSVLYSFGPFVLMFVTNFAILFRFITAKCKSFQGNSTESTNQAPVKSATRGTAMV